MNSKGVKRIATLMLLLSWALNFSSKAQNSLDVRSQRKKNTDDYAQTMEAISSVLGQVSLYFVDSVNLSELHVDGINYMLQRLDPYTVYMPKKEAAEFRESTTGNYGGIGAILHQRPDSTVIIDAPMKGKAADKAGLQSGDVILYINGKDFRKTTVAKVRSELRGVPGAMLRLQIRRPGVSNPFEVEFARESIEMSPVSLSTMLPGNIGYIRLASFMGSAYDDLRKAYEKLSSQGMAMSGLILDLRDNGGGLMQHAVDIVGMFVPKNSLVVELKTRIPGKATRYNTSREPIAPNLPLAVLIDGGSASASEIVAGALQDYDRAIVVGEKSFGKGLVQSTLSLPDSAILKVTTAHYYIPSGRCIQRIQYNHQGGEVDITEQQDSLGRPFYTQNKRVVYAAGGIMPDIKIRPDSIPSTLGSLLLDTLTYDFVTQYVIEHPQTPSIENFSLTDAQYAAYKDKVLNQKFKFSSQADALLARLTQVLQAEGRADILEPATQKVQELLNNSTKILLEKNEKEIRNYLNMSIIQRYYYSEGARLYTLPSDNMVNGAANLLRNGSQYQKLLQPAQKQKK